MVFILWIKRFFKILLPLLVIILPLPAGNASEAGRVYKYSDGYYIRIIGISAEEGISDAAAALRVQDYGIITFHELGPAALVLNRDGGITKLSAAVPGFESCYSLPKSNISMEIPAEPLSAGRHTEPTPSELVKTSEPAAENTSLTAPHVCSAEYSSGYNTVILNQLLLHPEKLHPFQAHLRIRSENPHAPEGIVDFYAEKRKQSCRENTYRLEDLDLLPLANFLAEHFPESAGIEPD